MMLAWDWREDLGFVSYWVGCAGGLGELPTTAGAGRFGLGLRLESPRSGLVELAAGELALGL
jgi:hypothetical protein